MKILITGGHGMVGRNLREHPHADQFEIIAPSRRELDLRDLVSVRTYFAKVRPDVIVHAAGKVGGIAANMADPYSFLLENVQIGTNVIAAAAELGVGRLLNLGSSCIYPRGHEEPLTEDLILKGELEPTNEGYAIAKIVALRLCQAASGHNAACRYKTIIPCNLYGRHDNFDVASAHLIPAVIAKVHRAKVDGQDQVTIWGDGTARREFMYAGDLASAVWRAVSEYDRLPDLMNVGLGHDHSILDYYRAVADVVGWHGRFEFDLTKPTGMRRKLVDVRRMHAWGWKPSTSLHDGIEKAYLSYLEIDQ